MLKSNSTWKSRLKILIGMVLVMWVLIPYWQVSTLGFVHYDDKVYVTDNPIVRAGITLDGIIHAFQAFDASNWHPVTWISHMLDCELYGLNPMGHHWTNLQFHIINTVLLFIWLQQITGALWRSAMVAALFGLHPLHVESVAWVAERKDVLSTFFGLLTLMVYYGYVNRPKVLYYTLLVVCFALGLMAKPMLVTFPFLLLLLDIWPLKRTDLIQWSYPSDKDLSSRVLPFWILLIEKIPLILLSIGSGVLTYLAQQKGGSIRSLEIIPFAARLGNAFISYLSYLIKTFWPYPLAIFYSHPGSDILIVQAIGSAIAVMCISLIALLFLKKYPYIGLGWFWYLGTLVPVIGIIQVGSQAMADRYTYIPLIGIFIIFAWGANDVLKKKRWPSLFYILSGGTILSILTVCTYFQVQHWKNGVSLFKHAVQVTENNWLAHHNLGVALDLEGRGDDAIVHLQKALSIKPDSIDALNNLGIAFAQKGNYDQAMDYYNRALTIDANHVGSHINLGKLFAEKGEVTEAISHYRQTLRIDPANENAHYDLAVLLRNQRKSDEAIFHFEKALTINPNLVDAHYNLGTLLMEQNKKKEGRLHIAQALVILHNTDPRTINPIYADVFFKFGVDYSFRGQYQQAIVFFKKALEIKPDYEEARNNLKLLTKMLSEKDGSTGR